MLRSQRRGADCPHAPVRKREEAEHVARELQARGAATAAHYHAALSVRCVPACSAAPLHCTALHADGRRHAQASARNEVQERWAKGEVVVVVATVAFGMGVDKVCA